MTEMNPTDQVLAAAEELVRAFGAHDKSAYFACFSKDATFVFYNHPHRLDGRSAYERLWTEWEERDRFRVLSCLSSDPAVTMLGKVAIFTHTVHTRTETVHGNSESTERETIIFVDSDRRWLAVHEHLSALPGS